MADRLEAAMLNHFKTALLSLWSNKVRSALNILGVIIGVASVTTLIGLGEGLKKDMSSAIQGFGTNVIAITGGKLDNESLTGSGGGNPANLISGDILTLDDVRTLEAMSSVSLVTPTSLVAGSIKYNDKISSPTILGTYPNFIQALAILSIDKGQMFDRQDAGNVVVLGATATEALFGTANPIGKTVSLANRDFTVVGTLKKTKTSSLVKSEFDAFSIIPYKTASQISKGQDKVMRIYLKAKDSADVKLVKQDITEQLLKNHNNEEDFTVLTQDDMLELFNTFLDLATTMVSAIAAISLLVGGIGIMNIMLVTVTERTREIGLRKAVGAPRLAILWQFLIEAVTVTFVGALLGLAVAFMASFIVALKTDLEPSITPQTILLAAGVSIVVGVVFGLWPALRAARKDPIEALRYE